MSSDDLFGVAATAAAAAPPSRDSDDSEAEGALAPAEPIVLGGPPTTSSGPIAPLDETPFGLAPEPEIGHDNDGALNWMGGESGMSLPDDRGQDLGGGVSPFLTEVTENTNMSMNCATGGSSGSLASMSMPTGKTSASDEFPFLKELEVKERAQRAERLDAERESRLETRSKATEWRKTFLADRDARLRARHKAHRQDMEMELATTQVRKLSNANTLTLT